MRKALRVGQSKLQCEQSPEQRRSLIRYAKRITGDWDHAEDVVQEAYLRLSEMGRKQDLVRPGGYLARIVRNLAIDQLWRSRRDGEVFVSDGQARLDDLAAGQPTPEQVVLARNEFARLEAALSELPERMRIAVEMHRFGGAKLREIAVELEVSVTVAHELVVAGVAHCRSRLR
ncbi:sigma-70 family RNA polymerase sigma factor [Brevundimonas diminuta]|uniref:sigma-70 family RNA polymerase sigma factor n=1 Tax=Brevundimonas diminuta TaxID=293 RepID=UPI003D0880E2